jgi:3-dehydroquinate synthase
MPQPSNSQLIFTSEWSVLNDYRDAYFIIDEAVYLAHPILAEYAAQALVLSGGESVKSWEHVELITRFLQDMGAHRQSKLVAVGGGALCDVVGFVASIYMRGIHLVLFPTTVLAMVDAAYGGKTAINLGLTKNLVGTFYPATHIVYHTEFLKSLPAHLWSQGWAECIKHYCLLGDETLLDDTNKQTWIEAQVRAKKHFVDQDPWEKGVRQFLNLGHSFAHAIEKTMKVPHGSAVSIGMHVALRLSEHQFGFQQTQYILTLLASKGLPTTIKFDVDAILLQMRSDKKICSEGMRYVLLKDIGKPIGVDIAWGCLETFLNQLKHEWSVA